MKITIIMIMIIIVSPLIEGLISFDMEIKFVLLGLIRKTRGK
jgi:hypothetical protein